MILIVGAGQAGLALAAKLRVLGHAGEIVLIGEEPIAPYERPHLSKGYLLGQKQPSELYLRSMDFYTENNIVLRLGHSVSAIDRDAKTVRLSDGTLAYDQLALTIGARPRRLPDGLGGGLAGVHSVRTLSDAAALASNFHDGRRLLVVGGGYIGLEIAAVAVQRGLTVTLVEASPRILQRVAAEETADFFRSAHERHGVRVLERTGVSRLIGDGRVTAAVLSNGEDLSVDLVVVGIGIAPETQLAEDAGLQIDDGIATDEYGRTSDPWIWAAGDCASFPFRGGRVRLESVGNAIEQAEAVAANMLGAHQPYEASPWFWSDQYDVALQIAGLKQNYDHTVARVSRDGGRSIWYYRGDQLMAVDAMNDSRAYAVGKRLLKARCSPDPVKVSDPSIDLRSLLDT